MIGRLRPALTDLFYLGRLPVPPPDDSLNASFSTWPAQLAALDRVAASCTAASQRFNATPWHEQLRDRIDSRISG